MWSLVLNQTSGLDGFGECHSSKGIRAVHFGPSSWIDRGVRQCLVSEIERDVLLSNVDLDRRA